MTLVASKPGKWHIAGRKSHTKKASCVFGFYNKDSPVLLKGKFTEESLGSSFHATDDNPMLSLTD